MTHSEHKDLSEKLATTRREMGDIFSRISKAYGAGAEETKAVERVLISLDALSTTMRNRCLDDCRETDMVDLVRLYR